MKPTRWALARLRQQLERLVPPAPDPAAQREEARRTRALLLARFSKLRERRAVARALLGEELAYLFPAVEPVAVPELIAMTRELIGRRAGREARPSFSSED